MSDLSQELDASVQRLVTAAQQPTIVASESGRDSLKLGVLASGKIQWELKLYAQPGQDPYSFVTAATAIAEQLHAYYTDHKPGDPLLVLTRP